MSGTNVPIPKKAKTKPMPATADGRKADAAPHNGPKKPKKVEAQAAPGVATGANKKKDNKPVNAALPQNKGEAKNLPEYKRALPPAGGALSGKKTGHNGKPPAVHGPICNVWADKGTCKFGNSCRFQHGGGNQARSAQAQPALIRHQKELKHSSATGRGAPNLSASFAPFIAGYKKNKTFSETDQNISMWKSCFDIVPDNRVKDIVTLMLKSYLNFPLSGKYTPKAEAVVKTLDLFKKQLHHPADVKTLSDVLKFRLLEKSSLNTITSTTKSMVLDAAKEFKKSFQADAMRAMGDESLCDHLLEDIISVRNLMNEYIKRVEEYEPSAVEEFSEFADNAVMGWLKTPTVGWLSSGCLLNPPKLRDSYSSVDEYALIVQHVWTMLTFFHGITAMWPSCSCRTGDKDCKFPLTVPVKKEGTSCSMEVVMNGRRQQCENAASYKCFRSSSQGHKAICSKCLQISKNQLTGNGGGGHGQASTDIYDAEIKTTSLQDNSLILHMGSVSSRKPPAIATNWRTSYRLQPAALVGIVLLDASKLGISSDMPIYWGEMVTKTKGPDAKNDEFRRRATGEMSVRVLSRSDCSELPGHMNLPFSVGCQVAVIDLRVFVPEVIPVLATLSNSSFVEGFKQLPFSRFLLGSSAEIQAPVLPLNENINAMIYSAIMESQLACLQQLGHELRDHTAKQICSLTVVRSLDRTQGKAFAAGLFQSLHCTQGPPGTGKSYVGVCLVLALVIIRDALKKTGRNLGPILALSYKNHAIDEFLIDVLNNNNDLKRAKGSLIRLGKADDELLSQFTERSSSHESDAQKKLDSRLAVVKNWKAWVQQWTAAANNISLPSAAPAFLSCIEVLMHSCEIAPVNEDADVDEAAQQFQQRKQFLDVLTRDARPKCRELLRQLDRAVEHWDCTVVNLDHLTSLIHRWMSGEVPPPRCPARNDNKQCTRSVNKGMVFCDDHTCQLPNCKLLKTGPTMCHNHQCISTSEVPCGVQKLSQYPCCQRHSCVICVTGDNRGLAAACAEHQCQVNGCSNTMLSPLSFCSEHCCLECFGINSISKDSFCLDKGTLCTAHSCGRQNCCNPRSGRAKWCGEHMCGFCTGEAVGESGVCINHKCKYSEDECRSVRALLSDGRDSAFCEHHTCFKCISAGAVLDKDVFAPSYTCMAHPLCQGLDKDGGDCNNLANKNGAYCDFHEEDNIATGGTTCCGTTKKGKQCKTPRPDVCTDKNWYCLPHADQGIYRVGTKHMNDNDRHIPFAKRKLEARLPMDTSYFLHRDAILCLPCKEKCCTTRGSWDYDLCPLHSAIIEEDERKQLLEAVSSFVVEPKSVENVPITTLNPKDRSKIAKATGQEKSIGAEYDDPGYTLVYNSTDRVVDEGAQLDADERDVDDFGGSDGEFEEEDSIGAQQQHLNDIMNEDEEEDEEGSVKEVDRMFLNLPADDVTEEMVKARILIARNEWNWDMSPSERHNAALSLISLALAWFDAQNQLVEAHIDEARQERAVAGAFALKKATVIGGTIVGAAKRLAAIQASEPFAIVVEEACEVMEPTLIAVLSVKSLMKLELIGDHRQLPAFVNNCWYDVELMMPSIKKSLFERLVCMDSEGDVESVCTVLDVQRRMIGPICDLTRFEYEDVVNVQDHECTTIQKVGDRIIAQAQKSGKKTENLTAFRQAWASHGRDIPGLCSSIYFWDLENNATSQPKAGISACNENEADACTELVKYMMLCGIPAESITIITPYQGQKRELISKLRNEKCLPRTMGAPRSRPGSGPPQRQPIPVHAASGPSLIVSTVDRYQGDENDVVILSLVRTKPGNQFVNLLNRFIVAASRARLGFYIIGSKEAVVNLVSNTRGGPLHWNRFVDRLSKLVHFSADSSIVDAPTILSRPRIGSDLPICCPAHRSSVKCVPSKKTHRVFPSQKNWNSLCSERCTFALQCGHMCALECHLPSPTKHRERCQALLARPCHKHQDQVIECSLLKFNHGDTLRDAMSRYQCDAMVEVEYKNCDHMYTVPCYQHDEIEAGKLQAPHCERVVKDFCQPGCGHVVKKPLCWKRNEFEIKAPQCQDSVTINPACGHSKKMPCYKAHQESSCPTNCNVDVNKPRPRCGHPLSMRCHLYDQLVERWKDREGDQTVSVPQLAPGDCVEEGGRYGCPEHEILSVLPKCVQQVEVLKQCGHKIKLPCGDAFSRIATDTLPACTEAVPVQCAFCVADIFIPCHQVNVYKKAASSIPQIRNESDLKWFFDNDIDFLLRLVLSGKCTGDVNIQRSCNQNHQKVVSCRKLLSILKNPGGLGPCSVSFKRPLKCGHEVEVKCNTKDLPEPLCRLKIDDNFVFPCGHVVHVSMCGDLQEKKSNRSLQCLQLVKYPLSRCGHNVSVPCNFLLRLPKISLSPVVHTVEFGHDYCQPCMEAPECDTIVHYRQECGHFIDSVKCNEAFSYALGDSEPLPCIQPCIFPNPLCGHSLNISCIGKTNLASWAPWPDAANRPRISAIASKEGSAEVICYPFPPPVPFQHAATTSIACHEKVWVKFDACSHSRIIHCGEAYNSVDNRTGAALECTEVIDGICGGDCALARQVSCHDIRNLPSDVLDSRCRNHINKHCNLCKINLVDVACGQGDVKCNRRVQTVLPCGHEVAWLCGSDTDPLPAHDERLGFNSCCVKCVSLLWEEDSDRDIDDGMLRTEALKMLLKEMGDPEIFVGSQPIDITYSKYEQARGIIIKKLIGSLKDNKKLILPRSIRDPMNDEYIRKNYDLVYLEVPVTKVAFDHEVVSKRFDLTDTPYGKGIQLKTVCKNDVCSLATQTGHVKIILALAFRANVLTDVDPFRVGNGEAMKKQANQLGAKYSRNGFDCVEVCNTTVENVGERVYWTTHAVVPLSVVELQLRSSCQICGDFFSSDGTNGALCQNKHFVCWPCFDEYLEKARMPDSINSFLNSEGQLKCPGCPTFHYDNIVLAVFGAPIETVKKLLDTQKEISSQKIKVELVAEQEKKWQDELKKYREMDEIEREVYTLRKQIIEDILDMRCPRCKTVFIDFEGCFALTCGSNICKAAFCAWCLKDCGEDAHRHVANCPRNITPNRDVFSDIAQLNSVWNRVRKEKIVQLLKGKGRVIVKRLLENMKTDLGDLDIHIVETEC